MRARDVVSVLLVVVGFTLTCCGLYALAGPAVTTFSAGIALAVLGVVVGHDPTPGTARVPRQPPPPPHAERMPR